MNKFSSFQEYISEIDYTLFLEMAASESNVKAHGGNPYLFNKHTQNFIHQFHPNDAVDALHWLHGEGLHEASKARHNAIGEYLKERFPDLSEDDRWHEYNDVQEFIHDDPKGKIAKALKELGEKYEKEGFLIKGKAQSQSYYEIKTLGKWTLSQQGKDVIHDGELRGKFSEKEIDIMGKGYFTEQNIKTINSVLGDNYKIGTRKKNAKGKWVLSTTKTNIMQNLDAKRDANRIASGDEDSKEWDSKVVKTNSQRLYKINPHFEQFLTNLEGENITRQDLLNISPDDFHHLSDPDHEEYGKYHHAGGDYTHPTDPDEKNLEDKDHERIKNGDQAPPFLYSAGSAISRNAIEDAHKGALLGTALNIMGDHKESWADHKGNEYEVEQRHYAHGSHKHFFIEATISTWSSEDRKNAFEKLYEKLKNLEKKMSHDHDDETHFRWKIGELINRDEGSSILVDGPNSKNDLTMWLSGTKKYDTKDHKFEKATPIRPPVQALAVGWVKKPTRFSIQSTTGRLDHKTGEVNYEGLQLPHISKDINYQEVQTFDDENHGKIHFQSEDKNETVNHPLLNDGSIMFKLKECLPLKRLVQLGIYRLKHKEEYGRSAHPEYMNSDKPEWDQIQPSDLKMLGGQSSATSNEGAQEIFRHWKKLTPHEQKNCTKQFSAAQLNYVRAMDPEDYHLLGDHLTPEEAKQLADRSLTSTMGGIGANGMKATQAHHPLHKYKGRNYMNQEYHALHKLAVGGLDGILHKSVIAENTVVQEQGDTPEEEAEEALRQRTGAGQVKTPRQIMDNTIHQHPGIVWKEAAIASYDFIRNADHISEMMKMKLWPSFPSIVQNASLRIIENLKHRKIGEGFERVEEKKDGETIIKFTYEPDWEVWQDSSGWKITDSVGSKARQNEAKKWLRSYVQLDHGTGTRRMRVASGSIDAPMGDEGAARSSAMSAVDTQKHIQYQSGSWEASESKPTHSWHDNSHGRHDNIRLQKGFLSKGQKIWASNDEAIQNKYNEELAKWVNAKIASDKAKGREGRDVFDPTEDDIPEQAEMEILSNMMKDENWLKEHPDLIGYKPDDERRHADTLRDIATKGGQHIASMHGPQDPGENLRFFKDLATNGKAVTQSGETNIEIKIGKAKFEIRTQSGSDDWGDWQELPVPDGQRFIDERKKEAILTGSRENLLNPHIKKIKNVLKGDEMVSQSTVSDAPSDAEIEQYDAPSDAEIAQYRTKIDRIIYRDSERNSDRKMQSLDWINKQLKFATIMTDPNKKKIAIKNVEDYANSSPLGEIGIGGYLDSFEESCENPTHGRLGIILELIRNKLNELQKLA